MICSLQKWSKFDDTPHTPPMTLLSLSDRAKGIRLVACDIDGTLTDGTLYFAGSGELCKGFSVRDGLGLVLLREAGIKIVVITGRSSEIVQTRANDLGFDACLQGVKDKSVALRQVCAKFGLTPNQAAMIGDDWPDLPAMHVCGLAVAVANAAEPVKKAAHWCSTAMPGHGAVREFAEWLLHEQGLFDAALAKHSQPRSAP
jgi:3-deoxy-D-manno-octulosonate 8-phosphate phosphatase (KDO 8-P phosphatase)